MREDRGENSSIGEITTLWSKRSCRTYTRCIVRKWTAELLAFKSLLQNFEREDCKLWDRNVCFSNCYIKLEQVEAEVCLLLITLFANDGELSALWVHCFQITACRLLWYNNWLLTLSYTKAAAQRYVVFAHFQNIKLSKCHFWMPTNKTHLNLRCLVKLRPCSPVDLNVKHISTLDKQC